MNDVKVISLGGSIIVPDEVDAAFLTDFYRLVDRYLKEDAARRLILVCGGGSVARKYQQAFRSVCEVCDPGALNPQNQDWVGIGATRLNAALMKHILIAYCPDSVVHDPTSDFEFTGRVLIASGWKPGFSTDFDAVVLGERFKASTVINLSNIARVYTDDPRTNPEAKPIDSIGWADFRNIVGEEWVPGKNVPFDPVASRKASEVGLKVIMAAGKNLDNLNRILRGEVNFEGTVIGPN